MTKHKILASLYEVWEALREAGKRLEEATEKLEQGGTLSDAQIQLLQFETIAEHIILPKTKEAMQAAEQMGEREQETAGDKLVALKLKLADAVLLTEAEKQTKRRERREERRLSRDLSF